MQPALENKNPFIDPAIGIPMAETAAASGIWLWGNFRLVIRTKPFSGPDKAGLKPGSPITRTSSVTGCVKMIEAVAVILGLFCAGIFVAHAVHAYRAR